jgi:RND family efflux transporter MFP subunit
VVVLAAAWAAPGCEQPTTPEDLSRPVLLATVEVRDLEEHVIATGQLLAKQRAEVSAQVEGEVTRVVADEGDAVEEAAIVIEIDPERRNLELARTRARLVEARATVGELARERKRQQALAEQSVVSRSRLEQAQTDLEAGRARVLAAEADLGVAERDLRDASVQARFPGLVARRFVSAGEFVRPGDKLFELVSLAPIEAELHLPESDAGRVSMGLPLELTVAPYPDELFLAVVTMVSPTIDERMRTLRIKALLPNEDGRLLPGMFARADLGIATRRAMLVPESAVLRRLDGAVVFRAAGGNRVERVVVETGVVRDERIEITQGLLATDWIVRRGQQDLVDGSVIDARNADGTPDVAARAAISRDPSP